MKLKTNSVKKSKDVKDCPTCHGTGKIQIGNSLNKQNIKCHECRGTGVINKYK